MSLTVGQMFTAGDSLVQLLPGREQQYHLLLWLPNHSIPFVQPGEAVNIRYDAYPYEKYGQFPGKVIHVASVPVSPREIANYSGSLTAEQLQNGQAWYKTLIDIPATSLSFNGQPLMLSNGMSAQVTLFLEKRPLYQWMLAPYYDIKRSLGGPVSG